MYKPHNFKFWPDDELWKLLFAEYTNYFRRNGTPIPLAVTLFNIFRADLLGLIVLEPKTERVLANGRIMKDSDARGTEAMDVARDSGGGRFTVAEGFLFTIMEITFEKGAPMN